MYPILPFVLLRATGRVEYKFAREGTGSGELYEFAQGVRKRRPRFFGVASLGMV